MKKKLIIFICILIILTGCNNNRVDNIEEVKVTEVVTATSKVDEKITDNDIGADEETLDKNSELLIDIEVYVNDVLMDITVYENVNKVNKYDNLSDFVQAQPIMDLLGITYSIDEVNDKIVFMSDEYNNTERTYSRVAEYIEDELYVTFAVFRLHTQGSLKQEDDTSMYLYTSDFERIDLPTTLEECYAMLDEQLSEKDIEFIKNSTEEERIDMHFGVGVWIRNEWLYPTQSKLTSLLSENEMHHIDDMSSIIIEGYYRYLNGEPCSLNEMLHWYLN